MKKILSGILALTLAGALTMPAFAAEGAAITAMNVTTSWNRSGSYSSA